jgi:hypothetical protein
VVGGDGISRLTMAPTIGHPSGADAFTFAQIANEFIVTVAAGETINFQIQAREPTESPVMFGYQITASDPTAHQNKECAYVSIEKID